MNSHSRENRAPTVSLISVLALAAAAPAQMAFDTARNRLVIPGAEWDGTQWRQKPMPPATLPVLVNDPVRQRVISMGTSVMEWDGHAWSIVNATNPFAVSAATYVQSTNQILTLRMQTGTAAPAETWAYTGNQWQQIVTAHSPAFATCVLADDPVRNRVVAVGVTLQGLPQVAIQLWEFDGVDWSFMQGLPLNLAGIGMAHDPVRGAMLLVAREAVASWDGLNLTVVATTPLPTNVTARIAFDPIRGQVVRFSNAPAQGGDVLHAWNGNSWQPFGDSMSPIGLLVYDEARDRLVVIDGPGARVHEWDGGRWTTSLPANAPVLTGNEASTYDPVGGRTFVLRLFNELWSWDGTAWQQHASLPALPLNFALIAYDRARRRLVLWGSRNSGPSLECWQFDGQNWTQVTAPAIQPTYARMNYDVARQRMVLMGGFTVAVAEFDGTTWTTPVLTPAFSSSSSGLTYDPVRGGVLYSTGYSFELWNGQVFTTIAVPTTARPPNDQVVFDTRRQTLTAIGFNKVWRELSSPATVSDYGSACGRPGDTVSLSPYGLPRPNATFELDVRAAAPSQPFAVVLGTGQASVPISSMCTLLVQNAGATLFALTNAAGFGHQPISVPNSLVLRGLVVTAQAGVLDPLAPLGFALTQGLSLFIGD